MGGKGRDINAVKVATLLCIANSHFLLFLHLKKHMVSQKFHENKVTMWLHAQAAEFCDIRIQNLIPRLNKCLDNGGDYVEK